MLPQLEPKLILKQDFILPNIPGTISLKALKKIEDCLDSLICAYVAAYWWYWGGAKNIVLGGQRSLGFAIRELR